MSFTKVAPAGIGTEPGTSILIGDSLLHSTGIDIGSNTGIGVTIRKHGDATFTGIITASAFFGDGSGLEGVSSSGIGTPLSDDDTSDLNKVYYVNQELSIGSTVTVNHPSSAVASYTHYQDLVVTDDADFIVSDGDTFIPDVLGIRTSTSTASAATGGRIRAGTITNAGANGAPNFPNGLTGTAGTFTGAITAASGTITGNLGVAGVLTYEDVTNIDSVGIITARSGINVSSGSSIGIGTDKPSASLYVHESNIPQGFTAHTDTAICAESSTNANIEIATGHNSTGALYFSDTGATAKGKIEYLHGSSGDLMTFQTNGGERLRIGSAGQIGIAGANYGTSGQVLTSQGNSSAVQWATPSPGITMADQWRLHTSQNGGASASNVDLYQWERVDTAPQGTLGSAMTLSNSPTTGVFSFPSTGIYQVSAYGTFHDGGQNMHYARFSMFATTNNAAYNTIAEGYSSSLTTTQGFQTCYMESIIDVTNISNIKLKFGFSGLYNVYCMGETSANRTASTFIRLGDT